MDFFDKPQPLTAAMIGKIIGQDVHDHIPGDTQLTNVSALDTAGAGHLTFLDNTKYLPMLADTKASIVFCKKRFADKPSGSAMIWSVADPYRCFALVGAQFYPDSVKPQGLLKQSSGSIEGYVEPSAVLEDGVTVEPNASVGANCQIGQGTIIAAGASIGRGVTIGRDCYVGSGAVIQHAMLGDRVRIHSNCAIGQDGFGYAMGPLGHLKVPQLGRVIIQDDVEIGALTSVDRGSNQDTIIGEGTKIDNQVQIGHNVQIGRHCVIVSQVGIAGSAKLGDFVVIGGQSGVIGHITIGDGAQIAGVSAVHDNMPAGARWGGVPAKPVREWFKEVTLLNELAKKQGKT